MFLTIETLFSDAGIVSAIINRVNQTRKDTIYWRGYQPCGVRFQSYPFHRKIPIDKANCQIIVH